MKYRSWLFAVVLLLVHAVSNAASLAVVVDSKGEVVVRAPGSTLKPLGVLDYLVLNSEIQISGQGRVQLVSLQGSQEWMLEGPGRYRLHEKGIDLIEGKVPPKAKSTRNTSGLLAMEAAHKEKMALGAVVMRGVNVAKLLGPLNTPVLTNQPTLHWEYDGPVRVLLRSDMDQKVIINQVVDARELPLGSVLSPGKYSWSLHNLDTDALLDSSTFEVVGKNDNRRRGIKWPVTGNVGQRVVAAAALDQAGFSYDAWLVWRSLAASRPDDEGLRVWVQ